MKYKVFTRQYGEYVDMYEYDDMESLLSELLTIASLQTVELLDIHKNGKSLSRTKIKVLQAVANK